MYLVMAMAVELGLAFQYPPIEIAEPCESAKEEEYLTELREGDFGLDEPEWFNHVIQCLGDLKSTAAVNLLISLLDYRRNFWWDGTGIVPRIVLLTERYPAGRALARIGKPALPSVIKTITQSEPGSVKNDVLFYVLLTIFRNEHEIGLAFLQKTLIAAETGAAKERLSEMVVRYADYRGLTDVGGLTAPQHSFKGLSGSCGASKEEDYLAALRDHALRAQEPELFVHAINCLGEIKSVAAVNPLISLLPYRQRFWWDGTGAIPSLVHMVGRYPAGGALARIGEPALPSLIMAITKSDSGSTESDILLDIILTIFHYGREEGLLLLQKASMVAQSDEGKERLLQMARRYAAVVKRGEP